MTYKDSLKHLIVEQQRQKLEAQQSQFIKQTIKEHTTQLTITNDAFLTRMKRELNKINGLHMQRVVQFLKKL